MEIKLGRRTVMVGAATTILVAGIGLAILAAGGIVAIVLIVYSVF